MTQCHWFDLILTSVGFVWIRSKGTGWTVNSGSNSGAHICVVAVPVSVISTGFIKPELVLHSEWTTTTVTWPPSLAHEGRSVVRDDLSSSLSDIRANLLNFNPVTRPRKFMRCNGRGIRVDPKDHVSQRYTRRIYVISCKRFYYVLLCITYYHTILFIYPL